MAGAVSIGEQVADKAGTKVAEDAVINIKAAERMGKLHDRLRSAGYDGHALELMLVRLLFCLFAEDTTLFEPRGSFRDFIENNTREDGSDLGPQLSLLFQVLNSPDSRRQKNLDETLAGFPYVNGKLFEETLSIPSCDSAMRVSRSRRAKSASVALPRRSSLVCTPT